jgi:serine/threonine protein kinase
MNVTTATAPQLKIKSTAVASPDSVISALEIKPKNLAQSITCRSCTHSNSVSSTYDFEKFTCYHCSQPVCVPVESKDFSLYSRSFETEYFQIFDGRHKKSSFEGAVVTYNKDHLPDKKRGYIASAINKYIGFKIPNYLSPKYLVVCDQAYSAIRENRSYSVSKHLQTQGPIQVAEACLILSTIALSAHELEKKNIFDHFLPTDAVLDTDTHEVFLCDYGLRAEIVSIMGEHANLFVEMLAPETASRRPHNEASAVYSLGILACTMMMGRLPFSEVNPRNISNERELYIKEFALTELPDKLKELLNMNVHQRPSLLECHQIFLDLAQDH